LIEESEQSGGSLPDDAPARFGAVSGWESRGPAAFLLFADEIRA
jgi:hypothetical protein